MAEENKLNIFDVNNESDDIQESISKANKVTDEVVKKAAEKIAERRKEKLTNELINVVQECEYTEKSAALQLRRSNRVNQRMKTYMKDLHNLAEEVKSGKKPVTAWNDEAPALKKQFDKDLIEIDKDIDKSQNELNEIFPNSWSYRWKSLIPRRND